MYRQIFMTEFNYRFHVLERNCCIKCEFKIRKRENAPFKSNIVELQKHDVKKSVIRKKKAKTSFRF